MQINEALDKIIDWTKNQRAHEMKSPKANDEINKPKKLRFFNLETKMCFKTFI